MNTALFPALFSFNRPANLPTSARGIWVGSESNIPPGGTLAPTRCPRKRGILDKLKRFKLVAKLLPVVF